MTPDQDYGRFRLALVVRILEERLTPAAVVALLERAADAYPQIDYEECVRLRSMGEVWR